MNDATTRPRGGFNSGKVVNTIYIQLLVSAEIAQSVKRTDFESNGWSKDPWFDPDVRHYLSSNKLNVRSFTYVFTAEDQHSEWLKRNEPNSIMVWENILIFSFFASCLYRQGPALKTFCM